MQSPRAAVRVPQRSQSVQVYAAATAGSFDVGHVRRGVVAAFERLRNEAGPSLTASASMQQQAAQDHLGPRMACRPDGGDFSALGVLRGSPVSFRSAPQCHNRSLYRQRQGGGVEGHRKRRWLYTQHSQGLQPGGRPSWSPIKRRQSHVRKEPAGISGIA